MLTYTEVVLPDSTEILVPNPLRDIPPCDITAVFASADGEATFPPLVRWSVRDSGLLSLTASYINVPLGSDPKVRLRVTA